MAERRMFSKRIIDSANFLKMPSTSRLLYYDLGMKADDDGVVEAFNVIRTTGATEDDLKILVTKGFVQVLNEDLVSYITDWRENNKLRADRKIDSRYKDLLLQINPQIKLLNATERSDRKKYEDGFDVGRPRDNQGTSMGPHSLGQSSLGQDRLMIDRLYINYNKRDFDFENFSYEDKQNISKVFENCELGFSDLEIGKNNDFFTDVQLKRFDFLRDILLDIYFSNVRFILSRVNYQTLCFVENRCLGYENVENYFNYFKTALINKVIENNGGFNNG